MSRTVLFFLILLPARVTLAQEFLGVRNSNYAGVQSVFLNPASIVGSKTPWDINIVSVGLFLDNIFFYIPARQMSPFGFGQIANQASNKTVKTNYNVQHPDQTYDLASSAMAIGPSFYMPLNERSSIGFTMAVRGYAQFRDVSGHLGQNLYTNFDDKSQWNKAFHDQYEKENSVSWVEYGIHYAEKIDYARNNKLMIGGGISFLGGIAAAYANHADLNYMIQDSSHIVVAPSTLDFGRTTGYQDLSPGALNHGYGLSGNIGLAYAFGGRYSCNFNNANEFEDASSSPYVYKIGISLIDVGFIRFNKHSTAYNLNPNSPFFNSDSSNTPSNTGSISGFLHQLDSTKNLAMDAFSTALPAAVSIQADWNVFNNYYLNATIIKGIGHGDHPGITRPDVYSLTPRYETQKFEVSVPFSLIYYGHWQPRLGLAIRIGYFYFGGDAPGSILGIGDFEGTDIYAGIHIFPTSKKRKSDIECPDVR